MGETTKDRILDAVGEAIGGGGKLTYGAIARQAGLSRQTLYAHYPTMGTLLAAFADRARDRAGAEELAAPILGAATALDALDALVDFHLDFTPRVMKALMAVERERANDASVERAYLARPTSRRQLVHHVMTRLSAEGVMDQTWSSDSATDLVERLISATTTHELLVVRGWSPDDLRKRLLHTLRRTLVTHSEPATASVRHPTPDRSGRQTSRRAQ